MPALSWLDSSVGRALHRHRRAHGFESRSTLKFFQAFFSQLLKLRKELRGSFFYLIVILFLLSVNELLRCDHWQCLSVVLSIMLHKVVLTFVSEEEILKCEKEKQYRSNLDAGRSSLAFFKRMNISKLRVTNYEIFMLCYK